ncbi:MAG TPA: hypothetical protein VLA95_10735 [Gemmatimonadales bacterium]|nr:hypothetical protein [Gemmatimonadales bacterium]
MSVRRPMAFVLVGATFVLGCKDETVEPLDINGPPEAIVSAGGNDQSAPVGNELALPLSVRVTDADGRAVPAVGIAWVATGGTLSATADTTDENGTSSVRWLMPGAPAELTATAVLPGIGEVQFTATALPLLADGELVFRTVDAGGFHACGITISDERVCWGYNADGQLGGAAGPPSFYPMHVEDSTTGGNNRFRLVSNGWYHGCAVDFALEVFCWGENRDLRGLDNFLASFQDVDAGLTHSCGITIARDVACWGYSLQGQVGDGALDEVADSAVIVGSNYASVSAGGQHTCAIQTDGDLFCWGYNADGQVGTGGAGGQVNFPTAVLTGLDYLAEPVTTPPSPDPDQPLPPGPYVSAGYAHSCAIATSGAAYCWGLNGGGQLGDGSTTRRTAPAAVAGGLLFVRISAGLEHTCALTAAGEIYCWGDNTWGQLGDGGTGDQSAPVLVQAPGGAAFAWVSAGENHSCGVTTAGVAYCWGDNHYGQLGTGTNESSNVPVKVALQP